MTEAAFRGAIIEAVRAGASKRSVADAAGISHPTVIQIVRDAESRIV